MTSITSTAKSPTSTQSPARPDSQPPVVNSLPLQLPRACTTPQVDAVLSAMGIHRPTRVESILKGAAAFGSIGAAVGLAASILPGIGPVVAVIGGAVGAVIGAVWGSSDFDTARAQYEMQRAYMERQLKAGPLVYLQPGALAPGHRLTAADIERLVEEAAARADAEAAAAEASLDTPPPAEASATSPPSTDAAPATSGSSPVGSTPA